MAAPVETDLDVIQGATYSMTVTWSDTSQSPAVPISLANYRAHMQVRSKQSTTAPLLLDLASDGTSPSLTLEPGGQTGVISVRIGATDTAKLTRDCFYDLFVINLSDATNAVRLVYGKMSIYKSVSAN